MSPIRNIDEDTHVNIDDILNSMDSDHHDMEEVTTSEWFEFVDREVRELGHDHKLLPE